MTAATTKGTRIKREHLEELYLYLKEQVIAICLQLLFCDGEGISSIPGQLRGRFGTDQR